MNRPLCSVVMATYNRAHLLKRSLYSYAQQEFPRKELELVIIDDHSTDDTIRLVQDACRLYSIRYQIIVPGPKSKNWRDCGAILNYGIRAATGQNILITHPEVMPGRRSVAACVEKLEAFEIERRKGRLDFDNAINRPDLGPLPTARPELPIGLYAACKVYYLSPRDQERIDTVPWPSEGNLALRKIEGFYDEDTNGNPDYRHCVTDKVATPGFRLQTWDSWVFGGMSHETWKRLGGFWVTQEWGSCDVGFNHRRKALGIAEWTCPEDESIVCHQNHSMPGDIPTPRIEDVWKEEMKKFDLKKLCYPDVDELGW